MPSNKLQRISTLLSFQSGGIASSEIAGTATNNSAAAGLLGEYVATLVASGSPVTLTTSNTVYDIASIVLTAGDWDVTGNCVINGSSATITAAIASLNNASATIASDSTEVSSGVLTTALSETDSITLPPKRFSLSAGATIYMSAKVTKSAGTITGWGYLRARRVR